MYKKYFIAAIVLIFIGTILTVGYNTYAFFFVSPVDSPKGDYSLKVASGDDISVIAKKLEKDKVIPSTQSLTIQAKLHSVNNIQIGDYSLSVPDAPEGILLQIKTISDEKTEELKKLNSKPVIKITFKEGETLDQMIVKLVSNGVAKQTELEATARDSTKFDKTKYPFLPKPLTCTYGDLKTCAKYYLEGYLYPDTYNFTKDMQPVAVYETLLNNFKIKVWSKLSESIGDKDFYKIVTMASVMEKETGRTKGVTDANRDTLAQERFTMAGVFYNRLKQNIKWQSDVTAEYGTGKKLCQQTFTVPDCMKLDSPLAKNKYNTYLNLGYPIGPITSPQFDNINAALNPESNSYLYFVADATGKKYFAKNESEFFSLINKIDKINKDLGQT